MCTLSETVIQREKMIRPKGLGFIALPLWPYPFQLLYSTATTSLIPPTATAANRPLITNYQPPATIQPTLSLAKATTITTTTTFLTLTTTFVNFQCNQVLENIFPDCNKTIETNNIPLIFFNYW